MVSVSSTRRAIQFGTTSLVAIVLAVILSSIGEDILRAFCAGIGQSHPLYDVMGCRALENPSPEG